MSQESADLYHAFCIYMTVNKHNAVEQMTKHIRSYCHNEVSDADIATLVTAMSERYSRLPVLVHVKK